MRKVVSIFLLLLLMSMLIWCVLPEVKASPHSITVDGDPTDWVDVGGAPNTGTIGKYEYIWVDEVGDDTGNGTYTYPTDPVFTGGEADLKELRITRDADYVYFLLTFDDITDVGWVTEEQAETTAVAVCIDTDRVNGSGMALVDDGMDGISADIYLPNEALWEYLIEIALNDVVLWEYDGINIYEAYRNFPLAVNTEVYETIEFAVPIGTPGLPNPIDQIWRFSVFTGVQDYEHFREVYAFQSTWQGGGGADHPYDPDAYDAAFFATKANQEAAFNGFTDWNYTVVSAYMDIGMNFPPIQYEHELSISLEAPTRLKPGDSSLLNATVYNQGLNNETVDFFLLINSTVVNSTAILELVNGTSCMIDYLWTPTVEAAYNLTAYAPPVLGENVTKNNLVSKMVYVRYVDALISEYSELSAITPILDSMKIEYDIYNDNYLNLYSEDLNLLRTYRTVIFYKSLRSITLNEYSALQSYLSSGGNLLVTGFDSLRDDPLLADLIRSSTYGDNMGEPDLYVVDASHPIMKGPYGSFPAGYHISGLHSDCDAAEADTARNATTVAELGDGHDKIIVTDLSPGRVVLWNGVGFHDWTVNVNCEAMFKNTLSWFMIHYKHELIVSLDAPTRLEPGDSSLLKATIYNQGLNDETDVELQMLIDGAVVNSTTIPDLLTGSTYTLSYVWTPTVEATYNVTAYAPPVPGETVTANNVDQASVIVKVLPVPFASTGTHLRIGISEAAHYCDYDIGYGFQYPPGYEHAATGWWGEGFTFGYMVGASEFLATSYEDWPGVTGLTLVSGRVIIDTADYAIYETVSTTMDGRVELVHNFHFQKATKFVILTTTIRNVGTETLNGVRYRRIWDFDVDNSAGGDAFDVDLTRNMLYAWETHYVALAASWVNPPTEWDVDAWDDMGVYLPGPSVYTGPFPAYGDYNVRLEWVYSSMAPGEAVRIVMFHIGGDSKADLDDSHALAEAKVAPREHELAVSLEAPDRLKPGETSLLNATVYNRGLNNETADLFLMINGTVFNSTTIPELVNGTSYTISYLWTPTSEAMYNITAYAPPVLDENITINNIATKMVKVRPIKGYVLFDQTHGAESINYYRMWVTNLTYRGYVVDTHISGAITSTVLAGYDILVIPQAYDTYSPSELSAIQDFVFSGGGLLVLGAYSPSLHMDLTGFAGINWMSGWASGVTTDITFHAVTEGVTSVDLGYSYLKMQVSAPAVDLVRDSAGGIMLAVSELVGRVIGFASGYALQDYSIVNEDNLRLANNMIDWLMGVRYEHELVVYLEAPSFLMPGNSSMLKATVYNHGLNNETNVELKLMIDGKVVNSVMISELANDSFCTLSYLWTPTVEGTYNITAYTVPVSGENYTYNNRATRLVVVTYPLIHPIEGQWAKYTIRYFEDGKLTDTMQWNFTYDHYVSPYLINVTMQIEDSEGYEFTAWTVVNIMNRWAESGIWAGMWYFGWIETNITLGSTVNLLFGNATVVGSRIIEAGGYSPDCWELSQGMYTYWYDKETGLLIYMEGKYEYEGHSYSMNITLVATNILPDSTPPTIGIPSRVPDGDVLPGQSVKVSVKVTDALSGVKNVTLSYTINNGTTWESLPLNYNSSTGLYEATIPGQPAGTWVKYKIVAYDYAENQAIKDGTEPYCAYQVIPEFPSAIILLLSLIVLMATTFYFTKRKLKLKIETEIITSHRY